MHREENFIHEGYAKDPWFLWISFVLLATLLFTLWGGQTLYQKYIQSRIAINPFLQVTNREFSLFLWQNPEYMRVHFKNKTGYLPGFQYAEKIGVDPQAADQYVVAPPQIISLYHAWHRLIGTEFTARPIPIEEFREFVQYAEEWHPKYWAAASDEYINFFNFLTESTLLDLQALPWTTLPQEVRSAFQGWKNYFKEGAQINALRPTYTQMQTFLAAHPHYARTYWKNVLVDSVPNYLKGLESLDLEVEIPYDELTPFLRVAFFNFQQSISGT